MKLLSRKRISILIDNKGSTPSRHDLIKEIAKKFKVNENLVVIKHIYPQFGRRKTKLIVHIYEDENKIKMFEHENLIKKHAPKLVEKEKQKEEPSEEKEEPKAEEQKEVTEEKKKQEEPKETETADKKEEDKPKKDTE